jgi:hypothetical protein
MSSPSSPTKPRLRPENRQFERLVSNAGYRLLSRLGGIELITAGIRETGPKVARLRKSPPAAAAKDLCMRYPDLVRSVIGPHADDNVQLSVAQAILDAGAVRLQSSRAKKLKVSDINLRRTMLIRRRTRNAAMQLLAQDGGMELADAFLAELGRATRISVRLASGPLEASSTLVANFPEVVRTVRPDRQDLDEAAAKAILSLAWMIGHQVTGENEPVGQNSTISKFASDQWSN